MARLLKKDADWAFIEPFLFAVRWQCGHLASNHRLVLDGILWIARREAIVANSSKFEECRRLIQDADSALKLEMPPSEVDPLDPMERALRSEEQKKLWLFAAAQKLSAMTNYQVSLLSEKEQSVRSNLISGSEGLLAIPNKAEIDRAAALGQLRTDREGKGSSGPNEAWPLSNKIDPNLKRFAFDRLANHDACLKSEGIDPRSKQALQNLLSAGIPLALIEEFDRDQSYLRESPSLNETAEESSQTSLVEILSWGFGVCLATGLAAPIMPGSNTPALLSWIDPETRNSLLENPVYHLAGYMGGGLGGAIVPAILVYGIYWGIRRLIKPRTKINWGAILGLGIAFGTMSVLGSYSNSTASNVEPNLHTGRHSTSSIENSLAALAAEMSSQVPIQVDHMTTVTGVAAFGSTLSLYHSIDIYIEPTQIGTTRTDLLLQTRERVCQKPEMAALIEAGVSIYYRYSDMGGNLIDFTIRECN